MTSTFDFAAAPVPLGELGVVHFVAIGGSGMSAVARVMLERGVRVSGSDAADSPVLQALRELGATVFVGHDVRQLDGVDTVVVSSAIREGNVELAGARLRGIRVLHRAQALAATMAGSRRVAVAGANGKTTTTLMLTVALQRTGAVPSFAAGAELIGQDANAAWGSGGIFVAEADESDGSFLAYRPEVAVVTNVQPDHLDFYGTFERVQDAYAAFAATVSADGVLVACQDDEGSRLLAQRRRSAGARVLTYGFDPDADVLLTGERCRGLLSSATLTGPDGTQRALALAAPGRHNLLNAAAAFTAATSGLGADPEGVLAALRFFGGARRRFEVRGRVRDVTVVDDYAHNPGKVAAVVGTAAALVRPGRLHVVFQPHLYSRTRDFADGFATALAPADTVLLLDVYGAREEPVPGVSSQLVADHLRLVHPRADVAVVGSRSQVPALLAERAAAGDLILTVGAGDVTQLVPDILDALGSR